MSDRRILLRKELVSLMVFLVVSAIQLAVIPQASAAMPPECGPANDGEVWTDPDTGIKWKCRHVPDVGWVWVPTVKGNASIVNRSTQNGHGFGRAGLNIGNGGGATTSRIRAYEGSSGTNLLSRGRGKLAARIQYDIWNGTRWDVCRDSGWHYNSESSANFSLKWSFGNALPCGEGFYSVNGGAFYYNNNDWRGGWVWSGEIYLACRSCSPSVSAPTVAPAFNGGDPPPGAGEPVARLATGMETTTTDF